MLVILAVGVLVVAISQLADSSAGSSRDENKRLFSGTTLKEVGAGLYLSSKAPDETMPFIDHMTISGNWSQFERADEVFKGRGWKRIKTRLRKYPEMKFRLRIHAGRGAPSWVKKLGGSPVSGSGINCSQKGGIAIRQPANRIASCVPYFWTDAVLDEYEELMAEVARRFDHNRRILDVVNSACMTNWSEPFIRAGADSESNARLWNAGLNQSTDRHCYERSMIIHTELFDQTRVSLAAHKQWQIIVDPATDSDGVRPSWEEERLLLDHFRSLYGERVVIQHNGLDENDGCGANDPSTEDLLCWMSATTPPTGFQTEGDRKLQRDGADIYDAVVNGVDLGACFIEHNDFGPNVTRAKVLDRRLKSNC